MSKSKAVKIDHLGDMPLDLPGAFLRFERRHWPDGTSCLHIAKWGTQPETGRPAPWWPPQYTQIPWEMAGSLVQTMVSLGLWTPDPETLEAVMAQLYRGDVAPQQTQSADHYPSRYRLAYSGFGVRNSSLPWE
ncbi:MAG: hypothetical protein ACOY93_08500 [Bacillota bacterium]